MASPFNTAHETAGRHPDRLTLVNGRCFSITDRDGDVSRPSDGTVHEDVRMVSRLVVSIIGASEVDRRQQLALSEPTPFHHVVVSRPDPASNEGALTETYIHRQWVGRGVRHDIEIHNAANSPIVRTVDVELDTDFAHIFDVKSGVPSGRRSDLTWEGSAGALTDPDDTVQFVRVRATPAPDHVALDDKRLGWSVTCPARSVSIVSLSLEPVWDGIPAGLLFPLTLEPARAVPALRLERWERDAPHVVTDDRRLSSTVDTCLADLASLRIFDPDHPDRTVVAAGAPWFMTLFGRDSLLTSWMTLPFVPELALGVLHALAELQGTDDHPDNEEQPGKIIHELRRRGGTDAFADRGRYYGTVDATPLFVMVAAEAHRWGHLGGADLRRLWPHIRAAVAWVTRSIDADPNGFVRYHRSTSTGLVNQGWKDSWDGVTFADGRLPSGAIALSEVQGYAYAALRSGAELVRVIGGDGVDPVDLDRRAEALRERFDRHFWDEASSSYAIGLTDDGERIDAVTTNPGHALWCGVADPDRANRYLDRIIDDDLWSGWGLRTLSPTCVAYNPLSYHNGSVWPHDTAIVAAGAAAVGRFDVVDRLVDAALDVADRLAGRPPELFAGIARSVVDTPVDYPDSCSPQAWASASTLLNLRSSLGLEAPRPGGTAPSTTRPRFGTGDGIDFATLCGVRVGDRRVDVTNHGDSIEFHLHG
jgi:glycogen debranching enzyme